MVPHRFGSPVVVVLAVTVLGSFGTDSQSTALAAAQQSINTPLYAPHQAIVFDGSAEASRTFLVALSKAGFLTQFVKMRRSSAPAAPAARLARIGSVDVQRSIRQAVRHPELDQPGDIAIERTGEGDMSISR